MAGTIKEIAEKAGVSRGTVDRALNNRGRVNPEVAERIFEIAREMNYQQREKRKVYNQGKKNQDWCHYPVNKIFFCKDDSMQESTRLNRSWKNSV